MRVFKYIILFFVLITLSPSYSDAQSSEERQKVLNKANKEFMKQLKDKYDLKYIYVHVEDDGYWYFHAARKEDVIGVLNQQGEVVVPIRYASIKYKKPIEEGFTINKISQDTVWHRANHGCFYAHTYKTKNVPAKYSIYRLDGTVMVDDLEALRGIELHEGYIEYVVSIANSSDDIRIMYTQDGENVIPLGYTSNIMNHKTCIMVKCMGSITKGGKYLYGAVMLDGSLPSIPCQYASVSYDKELNQWIVEDPMTHERSAYNPNKPITSEMKDKGVEFFWSGKFDEVVEFYSKAGIDKPWAKFYSGAALLEKAEKMNLNVSSFLNISKKGIMDNTVPSLGIKWRQYFAGMKFDFELLKNLYTTGYQLLDVYTQEDTTFIKEVKKYTWLDLESRLRLIENNRTEFDPWWQKYVRENEAIMAQQQAVRQKADQQNKLLSNMLGLFLQNLVNGYNNAGSRRTNSSGRTSNISNAPSRASSTSRARASSSSSSSNASVQYRQCHKCSGTGDIFTTSTIATYGNDKKVICQKCGKEHWASNVHHHRKCDNCNGTGKVAK